MNKSLKLIAAKLLRPINTRMSQARTQNGLRPLIFTFHRIVSDDEITKDTPTIPFVRTSTFVSLIEYLSQRFQAHSAKELAQSYLADSQENSKHYAVTFDDGWRDNYTEAFPVLKGYKIPATIFMSVDYVGSNKPIWIQQIQYLLVRSPKTSNSIATKKVLEAHGLPYDPQAELQKQIILLNRELKKRPRNAILTLIRDLEKSVGCDSEECRISRQFLNWNEIKTMAENGIEFGSHTLNHPVLTLETKTDSTNEICESKKVLEEKLQKSIDSFAYPNGGFNEEVVQIVKSAGYRCAFNGERLPGDKADLFRIPRIDVNENMITDKKGRFSSELFELELSSIYSKVRAILKRKRQAG